MKRIVHVSAGLDLDHGGVAKAGRLLARVEQDYARQHHLNFRILSLAGELTSLAGTPIQQFNRKQISLTLTIWRYALTSPTVFVFDHLGPARACSTLPVNVPYAIFLHGVEIWRPLPENLVRTVRRAKTLMINSRYSVERARAMHPWFPIPKVIHLPLEPNDEAGEVDTALLARLGCDYLLIVGRLDSTQRHKGHDELIEALPQVVQAYPGARLVVVGTGDDRVRLEQLAASKGVEDNVIFTGFVNNATLVAIYRCCRVFVMPSRNDGFGFTYLEAMRARKPCVGLASGSAAEIIDHDKTGLLVDYQGIAEALLRLLRDPELAQRLGEAGYEKLQHQFTFPAFQKHVFEQLDYLTGR